MIRLLAAAVLSIAAIPAADAATVTFDDISSRVFSTASSFTSDGALLTYSPSPGNGFAYVENSGSFCTPTCSTNGTNAFYSFNLGSLTISLGGPAFALTGFDVAQTFTTRRIPVNLLVTGLTASGRTMDESFYSYPGVADHFQTFTADPMFSNLISVTFSPTSPMSQNQQADFALDNIVLSTTATSPVPLPASAPMFGAAVLALGAIGYGRKRKAAVAVAKRIASLST